MEFESKKSADGRTVRSRAWGPQFRLKSEATAGLAERLRKGRTGEWVGPSRQTLASFLEEWLSAIRATVRPSTWDSYRRNLTLHVMPRLGEIKLGDLQPSHLNELYASLAQKDRPLASKTIRYIHTIIHRALRDAVKWEKLGRNVAAVAEPPSVKHKEMKAWSRDNLRNFLSTTAEDRLSPLFLLAATSGMRRGELLGLRWVDLDLENRRLSIRQTLISVGYQPNFSEPKTDRSRRTISLDSATVAALQKHRANQNRERGAWGSAWKESGLVFTRENGEPIHPHAISDAFDAHVRGAGLPHLSFHGLRHTYATLALASGMKPWDLSDRLGHASVAFTLQVYRHAIPADQDDAASAAAAFILG